MKAMKKRWSEGAVVYHIYPRSFQDTNGDGVGDLQGVIQRLDYLKSLSVTAIWLSPFYPSPMADFGYDIADYCDVDPTFGTLKDFKELLASAEQHGIKVIIDLVPNHTSNEHAWFKESRQAASDPKADWYIWRDAADQDAQGQQIPPNNWRNVLTGESAWEWDTARKQFYLHSFDVRQPDLNWINPEVREAFKNIMRFWLDLGVDGFRVDAVGWLSKDPLLSDDALNPDYIEGESLKYDALIHVNSRGWPSLFGYLSGMADVLKEEQYQNKERFMVTEAYPERQDSVFLYMMFYVGMDPAVAAPFNFEGTGLPWEAEPWRRFLDRFHTALRQLSPLSIASNAFGNHDVARLATRLGIERARSVAVMLLTMPGMAFIYYGDELGMENGHIPPALIQDPADKGGHNRGAGRDPERTPMQWTNGTNAGFSDAAKPWLPVADTYPTRNVDTESESADSMLSLYRLLGKLRADSKALRYGQFTILESGNTDVLLFERTYGHDTRYVTGINFSEQAASCKLPHNIDGVVVSSVSRTDIEDLSGGHMTLLPFEAIVFEAKPRKSKG
jgi:alpha-glucosidase